jgi:GABA permease
MSLADDRVDNRSRLAKTLRSRHASMIAFGGTIGAGIFLSSGASIASAGPAVVLSYLVVGVLAVIVMRVLSIMTVHNPDSGSFASHAGEAFGHPGRFAVGWMYWWLMVVTASVECSAAGAKAHDWLGLLPAPAWSLLFMALLTAVNLAPVRVFGEFQFWLVLAKIVLVLAVPVLAVFSVLGIIPNDSASAAAGSLFQGGLVPYGFGPVVAVMLVAAFSFVGIEMTSIAAGETDRPRRVIPQAIRMVMYTVLGAYVLAMLMTVLLVPWNSPGVAASPFKAMMDALHIPAATTIIDIVVLTAVLSVLSSCIYAASRIGYSMAGHQDAPKGWGRLSPTLVPRNAVLTSAIFAAIITIITYIVPTSIANVLIDSSGAAGILTWIAIVLSYLKVRPRPESWQSIGNFSQPRTIFGATVAAVALIVVLIGMLFVPSTQLELLMTLVTVIVIFAVVMWRETNRTSDQDV